MSGRRNDSAWWWTAAGGTGLLALIGIANPGAASRAVLIAVVALAGAALVHAVRRWLQRVPSAPDSPFATRQQAPDDHHALPFHLERLRPTEAAGRPAMLSVGARVGVRTVATERLWKRHRLNFWHPAHAAAIRSRVSDDLWAAINVGATSPPIPQSALSRLLDEVEQL